MTATNSRSRWLAWAGLLAVAVAVVVVFLPGYSGAATILDATGLSESVVRALAFAIVGGGCLLWTLRTSTVEGSETAFPTVDEERGDHPNTVGASFDRQLERTADAAAGGRDHDDVQDHLFSLAVDVVAHTEACRRETALQVVKRGEWTDDPVAAAYLGDSRVSVAPQRRLAAWFRPRWATRRRARRTAAAIEARLDDWREC